MKSHKTMQIGHDARNSYEGDQIMDTDVKGVVLWFASMETM